ncbi:MAG: glycosyltransferase family 39 protein [Anaerolineaceae bacterium]|nr:glycosyltransferase family 39 protein [Anaerolineaceae bacterium]
MPKIRLLWLLIGILILATVVRAAGITSQSIWFDEGWSAYAAVQPTLVDAVAADPTNPPLYYVLLNLFVKGAGDSELALRWFSLLLGVLAIPLAYQLGRRLFNARAGWIAALLVALSPLLWWAAQEARMYTLLTALVLAAALAWHDILRSEHVNMRPTRAWWLLWASELALLYAHNTGPVIVLWLNAVTLLAWVTRRSLRRPDWRLWIAGQVGVALLWSPWFIARFTLLQGANSALYTPPEWGLPLFGGLWLALWAGPWGMVGAEAALPWLALAALVVTVLLIPWRSGAGRWLGAHTLILTLALLFGLTVLGNHLHGRYLVMIAPLPLVVLGAGIARIPNRAGRWALLAGFAGIFIYSLNAAQNPAYGHDDARRMMQYYADTLTDADTVLAWSYADRYELAYYWERLGVTARRVILPEGADLDAVLPLLPESGDVALNIWYTQRADYRGMMRCILGNGTTTPPESFTVYGMSSDVYRSPTLDLPELRPTAARFTVADVTAVGNFGTDSTADQAACLPLDITPTQPVTGELKAAVTVRNALGWEVAHTDAVFATANQRTTLDASPGEHLAAYPLLRLPYGAPPGAYTVFLRLYDVETNPSGYDALTENGTPAGKDMPIGTWMVEPGADWTQTGLASSLPVQTTIPAEDDLTLIGLERDTDNPLPVHNGDSVRLTLLWEGTSELPALALVGDGWQQNIPVMVSADHDVVTLDWRDVPIPPDAADGEAELRLPDGTVIARYSVTVLPALYEAPAYATLADVVFPAVGTLVGFTVGSDPVDRGQPLPVTLVWRAEQAAPISYTVFVQLINENGQVVAQSDAAPAGDSRPTTGWRPGEYIEDTHWLRFNENATPGSATLIAGLYDPTTGARVRLADGTDAAVLLRGVKVR